VFTEYLRLERAGPPVPTPVIWWAKHTIKHSDEWFPPEGKDFEKWRAKRAPR